MDNIIRNYKEISINRSGNCKVYYFKFADNNSRNKNKQIDGYYVIDEFDNKWLSVCAISSITQEDHYEKLRMKYFNINSEQQKSFYNISEMNKEKLINSDYRKLINIILANTRQGAPRRFIALSTGERINIEMTFKTINNFTFE